LNKTLFLFFLVVSLGLAFAESTPSGATPSYGTGGNATWGGATPTGVAASGGNVSNVGLSSNTQTMRWVGFYGDISGNVVLRNAAGEQFYAWTQSNASGYVLAAKNASILWATLKATPLTGAQIDAAFTFLAAKTDSGTATYNTTSFGGTVAGVAITAGVASSGTTMFGSTGNTWVQQTLNTSTVGVDDKSSVFMSRINNNQNSFNGTVVDYQLMVPEDESANTAPTAYYFYLQLD